MSIADKLLTIANNTPDVCAKLKTSKTEISGSVIAVNDVNETVHDVDINLSSKNLLEVKTIGYWGGDELDTAIVNADGSITLKGSYTRAYSYNINRNIGPILPAGNYFFSSTSSNIVAYVFVLRNGEQIGYYNGTFTIYEGDVIQFLQIRAKSGTTSIDETVYLQIEAGSTATEYEPYNNDFSGITVSRLGKNLYDNSRTIRKKEDGTVAVRILSGYCIPVTHNTNYVLSAINVTTQPIYLFKGLTKEQYIENPTYNQIWYGGTSIGNVGTKFNSGDFDYVIFRTWTENDTYGITEKTLLQLEIGTEATEYEPYKEPQTAIADREGNVLGLTSVSPNMTLTTDNDGVIINAKYINTSSNADTEKIKALNQAFANAKAVIQELRM